MEGYDEMTRTAKLLLAPLAFLACAWSWATYFAGRPADKEVYWRDAWGWVSPAMDHAWADWKVRDKGTFHELKNLGAEWARAWPQTAAKALAFIAVTLAVLAFIAGLAVGIAL